MRVVKVEPHKPAVVAEIENGLGNLQDAVGGHTIEVVYPWEDSVGLLCDENGKFDGAECNRCLCDEEGNIYDIVAGVFYIVGLSEDDFTDLTDEQTIKYLNLYKEPEAFLLQGDQIIVLHP